MSKYIDEKALIEEIERCSYETWSKGVNRTWWTQAVKVKDNIVQCIQRQPTADVEPVYETVRKVQTAFALHFGTFTGKDAVKVVDVFKLLDQIANEMCRRIDERRVTDVNTNR